MNKPEQGHRLTVAYLGTPFSGWQRQLGKTTVQETLEAAVKKLWKQPISVQASGRTDTGVHAWGQVVSFRAPKLHEAQVLTRALNANLPPTIRVLDSKLVSQDFHARFDATGKTYEYRIHNGTVQDPFSINLCWHLPRPLNVALMKKGARCFIGRHDFASFTSNPGYERETTVRSIRRFTVKKKGELILFRVTADGFLYRMVRNLVGALVEVGRGKLTIEELKKILKAKKRTHGLAAAPAHGLFLMKVDYRIATKR